MFRGVTMTDLNVVAPMNMGERLDFNAENKRYNVNVDDLIKRIEALEISKNAQAEKITVIEKTTQVFNVDLLIGMPFPYAKEQVPNGYIALKGQTITAEKYPKLFEMYGATLPDMRGEFIRGWDNGRGLDPGRVLGSTQKGSAVAYDPTQDNKNVVSMLYNIPFTDNNDQNAFIAAGYDLPTHKGDTYSDVLITAIHEDNVTISTYKDGEHNFRIGVSRPRNTAYQWICLAG